ncbi:MAG: hypothetical protein HRT35_09680 [Algicola sp.]|nr:hypothetical protein [Algicola sp.]
MSGVDTSSITVTLNDTDITNSCDIGPASAICNLENLNEGIQLATILVPDNRGKSSTETLTFIYFSSTTGSGLGSRWFSDSGAPSNTDGRNGDYYLNADTGDVYKKLNSGWDFISNIKRPSQSKF